MLTLKQTLIFEAPPHILNSGRVSPGYMTMFRNLIFDPSPRPQVGGDPKNCAGACAILCHSCEKLTHQICMNFGKRNF